MAYQNGNLAYDISVYEPKVKDPGQQKQERPQIQVRRHKAVKTQSTMGILISAAAVLVIMFAMLYGKVETNRLFGEVAELEQQLQSLEAENVALASEYESRTSLKNVEEYAQNTLGLQKLDKAQIEYVEFEGDSVIEVVDTEKQNIFVRIKNWFADVCEYLGL